MEEFSLENQIGVSQVSEVGSISTSKGFATSVVGQLITGLSTADNQETWFYCTNSQAYVEIVMLLLTTEISFQFLSYGSHDFSGT